MTLLYLNSDRMGVGDDALGRRLLVNFIKTLAAGAHTPDLIGCVNHGVLLTCEDSPVLEELRTLQARGATVASCGTCLDALGLRDKLQVGEVGDMTRSVEAQFGADRIISPC